MNNRVFGLDVLRAIAIIFVLIAHTGFLLPTKYNDSISTFCGFIGVEVFFVLSGFLIGGILIKLQQGFSGSERQKLIFFWVRRWFRTLPNYYLMLFIYSVIFFVLLKESLLPGEYYFSYFIFFQNAITPHPKLFQVAWSLCIEEWFYLTFPLVILVYASILKKINRQDVKLHSVLLAILTYIIGCLALRIYFTAYDEFYWDNNFRKMMPFRLDSIAIGVLFAYFKVRFPSIWRSKNSMLATGLVSFLTLCAVFIYEFFYLKSEALFIKTFFFTLFSLSIGLVIPFFESKKEAGNSFFNSIITKTSIYSYSIYLIHPIIVGVINHEKLNNIIHMPSPVKFALIWVSVYFVSSFQFKYFEHPMTSLREKWNNRKS
jgi:peptidoglycan/LPS O-acetylase OafA/YrhL